MLRIAALNDSVSSGGSQNESHVREVTKEAKEAEAFDLYGKALDLLRHGELTEAEDAFNDLIDHEFLIEAWDLLEERGKDAIHPGLQLLYSIQKNLAAMATKRKDHSTALDCYLEAVKIDDSEVTVWYKIGVTALALEDFQLAMLAFEHGLDCNPKHWPCLDNVITILFALSNYVECLYYISKAFELEVHYNKGHAFKEKIFSEQRSFERETEGFFKNCDPEIKTISIDTTEAQQYIEEALTMRRRHSEVCQPPKPALLSFPDRIKHYSWTHVGEILTKLYDKAMSDNTYSIGLRVEVPDYKNLPEEMEQDVDVETVADSEKGENSNKPGTQEPKQAESSDQVESSSKNEDSKQSNEPMECNASDEEKKKQSEEVTPSASGSVAIEDKMDIDQESANKNTDVYAIPGNKLDEVDQNESKAKSLQGAPSDACQMEITDTKKELIASTNEVSGTPVKVEKVTDVGLDQKTDGPEDDVSVSKYCKPEKMDVEETKENTDIKPSCADENVKPQVKNETTTDDVVNVIRPERPSIESISDEDSSSISEAMIAAHALLDSLSPCKSKETYALPHSPRHPKSSSSPGNLSSAVRKAGIGDIKTDSQSEGIKKHSSYGFTVSDLFQEDTPASNEADNLSENTTGKSSPTMTTSVPSSVVMTTSPQTSSQNPIVIDSSPLNQGSSITASSGVSSAQSDVKCSTSIVTSSTNIPTSSNIQTASLPQTSSDRSTTTTTSVIISSQSATPTMTSLSDSQNQSMTSAQSTSISAVSSQPADKACYSLFALSASSAQTVSQSMTERITQSVSQNVAQSMAQSTQSIIRSVTPSLTKPTDSALTTVVPTSISEHGYSRSYCDMPTYTSTPRKLMVPPMNMKSPGSMVLEDSASSASYIEIPMDIDDRSPSSRKSQKRKRPSLATEDVINYGKRRSARVRNTGGRKKEEETVNFSDLLHTFLPSSIKDAQDDENVSLSTEGSETENTEQKSGSDKANNSNNKSQSVAMVTEEWNEEAMVKSFLDTCINNTGLLDMCCSYLHILAKHFLVKWPAGLCEMYLSMYERIRKHMYIPRTYEMKDSPSGYQRIAQICLVQVELQLDTWVVSRSKLTGSVLLSPRSFGSHGLTDTDIPALFDDDVTYLTTLCSHRDMLDQIWINHCIRVYWMKARFALLRNEMEEAMYCYDMIKEYLEFGKTELDVDSAYIPNCQLDNFVDLETVNAQYELLQQTRSVEQTEKLYEKRDYKKVVEVLLQNFTTDKQKNIKPTSDIQERQSQITMLLEALFNTEEYEKCMFWGEELFNECYCMYKQSCKSEARSSWVKTMITVFSYLNRGIKKNVPVMKCLGSTKTLRFSKNLIKVIDVNMSLPESIVEMAIDSVLPWILLYHVIKQEEDRLEQSKILEETNADKEENVSSSQMLLNIAHDSLGSRCWCTKSDGALLEFYMSLLKSVMNREPDSKFLEEYQQSFEQCVYCMYGHPNKKGKAKHLQDHNVNNVTLCWENAVIMFDYFKPRSLPEFDGYRSETITAEMENLLKRIIPLIPDTCKTMGVPEEQIRSYIEGTTTSPPVIQEGRTVTLPVVDEIHYLLGDYYLKNKEHGKAIKFYIQDLCMNPGHLDAWAGMALARMSQVDTKLTSADLKMSTPVYKKSIPALRCFKRAVEIDDSNSKLWIEYGTLAYQLHSHASRQLKWLKKKWFEMDDELVKIARDSKQEMLLRATECFKMAADFDWSEDAWLHNYMLGKCADKAGKDTKVSLEYYYKALECLHAEKAKYPRRIVYAYTTPHLAVEALEMFYRIHVAVLKALFKYGPESSVHDYKQYVKYIVNAANSPFAKRVEKGQTIRTDRDPGSSADESSCLEPASKKPKQQSSDHTYFKNTTPGGKKNVEGEQSVSTATVPNSDDLSMKSVTTLELHSEDQDVKVDITMTTTENVDVLEMKSPPPSNQAPVTVDHSQSTVGDSAHIPKVTKSPFSIDSLIGKDTNKVDSDNKAAVESGAGDGVQPMNISGNKPDINSKSNEANKTGLSVNVNQGELNLKPEPMDLSDGGGKTRGELVHTLTDKDVKTVLSHIEDLIEAEMAGDTGSPKSAGKGTDEHMEVNVETPGKTDTKLGSDTPSSSPEESTKIDDQINTLLKLSNAELHQALMEKCRLALVTCLQRFPTHYKSHYRLAYLYLHSPYHKDLTKVHHILLGAPKWQQLDYMPCQGLFGERKQTKFFQGIWKIPIDEIDRSGSFPSHLNRCIELALHVLKIEKDSQTLHQVHLQLNRQPEAGKKYLRDMEKKYYALISHEYTLDAVEGQIEEMKVVSNVDERSQFLMTVYKIYEHGVHKLNKHTERTSKLLAEAYRVVLRKYETLPFKMLLAEAVRYCKQQITQKHKDKVQHNKGAVSSSSNTSTMFTSTTSVVNTMASPKQAMTVMNLDNIMKSQTNNISVLKSPNHAASLLSSQSTECPAEKRAKLDSVPGEREGPNLEDVIVLSDSSSDFTKTPEDDKKQNLSSSQAKPSPSVPSNTPTVKIKMGLLQAVKRLKPNTPDMSGGSVKQSPAGDVDTSQDEAFSSAVSENESEAPIPSTFEDDEDKAKTQSESSSSSSSSSSSDSSSDESDVSSSDDDGSDNDDGGDEESDSDDDNDNNDDDNDGVKQSDGKSLVGESGQKDKQPVVKLTMKKITPTTEDEEESSDNADEIDLISSDDNDDGNDDDKDKDYNASDDDKEDDDDDVIMISDEEYGPKGKAVIPSPPHTNKSQGTEVLVKDVPDYNTSLISSMMLSEVDLLALGQSASKKS